ncbi:hypothetical protein ACIKTA_17105 [Hansschlegelia beijingensis]
MLDDRLRAVALARIGLAPRTPPQPHDGAASGYALLRVPADRAHKK